MNSYTCMVCFNETMATGDVAVYCGDCASLVYDPQGSADPGAIDTENFGISQEAQLGLIHQHMKEAMAKEAKAFDVLKIMTDLPRLS